MPFCNPAATNPYLLIASTLIGYPMFITLWGLYVLLAYPVYTNKFPSLVPAANNEVSIKLSKQETVPCMNIF